MAWIAKLSVYQFLLYLLVAYVLEKELKHMAVPESCKNSSSDYSPDRVYKSVQMLVNFKSSNSSSFKLLIC